ncbi:hypothetical protein CMI47_16490 [Candidatus Pacearchaeota archaeon]|jgi:hypothetical protein|nr:hypothetical protein [Candidatus Pacearchaeota archaeon]|tara:strand:+ start:13769 stop:13960 length:192 start_codon:yes stop_codon:yes gene_type:complete
MKDNYESWFGDYLDIDKVKCDYSIIRDNDNYIVINSVTGEAKGTHSTYKTAKKQKKMLESWII